MKFSEVVIGQKFVFNFDESVKDGNYYWSYEKVGNREVKCLTAPKTAKECIGNIYSFMVMDELCNILEESQKEEKKMNGYKITSNGMNIGTAYDKETLIALVRYVFLSCYYTDNPLEQKGLEIEFGGFSTFYSFIDETVFDIVEQYFD